MPQAKIARLLIEAETTQVSKAERDLQKLGKTARTTTGETGKLGRGFDKTGKEAAQLSRQANKTSKALKGISTQGLITTAALTAVGYAAIRAGQAASRVAIDFEKAVAEVGTLGADIGLVAEQSRDFASIFSASATQQVGAYYQAVSAGAKDATEAVQAANVLATGGVASLDASITLLTGTLNAFSAFGYDATQVSDIFFSTVKNGITTIPALARSFANLSATAANANVNLEVATSALAALTASGTPTAQATTQVRALLVAMQKASPAVKAVGAELGITSFATKDFTQFITQARAGLQAIEDPTKRAEAAFSLFGAEVEAFAGFNSLAGGGFNTFIKAIKDAENSAGFAQKAFEELEDTMANRLAVAYNKVEVAQERFGTELNKVLIPSLERGARGIEYLGENLDVVAGVATALGVVAIPVLGKAIYGLVAPITLATGGLNLIAGLAVGTAFYAWTNSAIAAQEITQDLGDALDNTNDAFKRFASEGTAKAGQAVLKFAQIQTKALEQQRNITAGLLADAKSFFGQGVFEVNESSPLFGLLIDTQEVAALEQNLARQNKALLSSQALLNNLEKTVDEVVVAERDLKVNTDKTTQSTDELTESQAELNDVWQAGLSLQDNFSKGMQRAVEDELNLAKAIDETTLARQRGVQSIAELAGSIGDGSATPQSVVGQLDGIFAQGGAAESLFGANSAFVGAVAGALPIIGAGIAVIDAIPKIIGKTSVVGGGLALNVGDSVSGNAFENTYTSGLAGVFDKIIKGTRRGQRDIDFTDQQNADLNRLFSPLIQRAMDFEEAFSVSFTNVALKGEDTKEVINQYNDAIAGQVIGLQKYRQAGEENIDTLTALANAGKVLNGALTFAGFGGQFDKNVDDAGNARLFQQRLTAGGETGNFAILNNSRSLEEQLLIEQRGLIRELEQNGGLSLQGKTLEEVRNAIQGLDPSNGVFQAGVSAVDNIKRIEELTDAITRRDTGGGGSFSSGQIDNNRFASLAEQRIAEGIAANALGETKQDTTNRLLENLIDATISGDNKQLDLANKQLILAVKSG